MKIAVEDFNSKLQREDIFKLTIENKSLHQDSKYNGVRIVNSHQKIWLLRARCSYTETFITTPGTLLMGGLKTRLITY
jgi:hypothetical protein